MFNVKVPEIDKQLNELVIEREKLLDKFITPLDVKILKLKKERKGYIFKNKLYRTFPLPQEDIGKEIFSITFVDKYGNFDTWYNDEIFEVDKDGYPYYSSYTNGIMEYNPEENCLQLTRYGCSESLEFIGYSEIEFCKE